MASYTSYWFLASIIRACNVYYRCISAMQLLCICKRHHYLAISNHSILYNFKVHYQHITVVTKHKLPCTLSYILFQAWLYLAWLCLCQILDSICMFSLLYIKIGGAAISFLHYAKPWLYSANSFMCNYDTSQFKLDGCTHEKFCVKLASCMQAVYTHHVMCCIACKQ